MGPRRTARGLPPPGRARGTSGREPGKGVLAGTRWGDRGWVHGEFQMLEDFPDHRALRDGGDDPQRPLLAERAARRVQRKHPLEQPRPTPPWRPRVRCLLVDPLLAGRWNDGPTQVAVRRQTAAVAHQVHARQGHEGRQLLQEFQRREPNAWDAIGPRGREGVNQIAVGVLGQALQGHGPTGRIADQALQLIAPMGGDQKWWKGKYYFLTEAF